MYTTARVLVCVRMRACGVRVGVHVYVCASVCVCVCVCACGVHAVCVGWVCGVRALCVRCASVCYIYLFIKIYLYRVNTIQ